MILYGMLEKISASDIDIAKKRLKLEEIWKDNQFSLQDKKLFY